MRTIFLLGVLLCGFCEPADAACTVPRWRFVWGIETNAYAVTDGGPCRLRFIWASGKTEVHSIGIASPPHNGTASASGHDIFYKPRGEFKGEDSFVFAINGRENANSARATVRVNVTVR
jgi:hypothetical protein